MPTLFRFLVTLGVLAGLVYAGMLALVLTVEPRQGEITIRVPIDRPAPGPTTQDRQQAAPMSPQAAR